jgi:2-amino-4-hydroxy-6-hydroxymethyldihydropteridine diphosphokinase
MVFYCLGITLQQMNTAYLITGGNIGNREEQLAYAARLIEERCGSIIDRSSLYETAAWGKTDQAPFLNQALVVETTLNARDLLHEILYIENLMGRDRIEKYGPRIIDIDIIFFNHQKIREDGLVVPHPQMAHRRFVLEPLNEVIPAYIHPVFYKTVNELLIECDDSLPVKKIL